MQSINLELSGKVRDGILGKLIYTTIAILEVPEHLGQPAGRWIRPARTPAEGSAEAVTCCGRGDVLTPGPILAAILLGVTIGFGGAWQVQDWRMGKTLADQAGLHKDDLAAITNAAADQARAEQDKRLATEQTLAASDQQHTKELSDAQRHQARLRDQLATADVRLSVLLDAPFTASGCDVPAAPGAVGVVHAARRAQLAPAHAQRIVAITDYGDQGLISLRACQAYVRAIAR